MILNLQGSSNNGLTVADVEAVVYRILDKEAGHLKASAEGSRREDLANQVKFGLLSRVKS